MRFGLRTALSIMAIALLLVATGPLREPIAAAAQKAQDVFVTNDPSQPVPVKEQARTTPVQVSTFTSWGTGETFTPDVTLYTVPEGKIFVVEGFSVSSNNDPTDRVLHVVFNLTFNDFLPYAVSVQPTDEGVFTPTNARVFRGVLTTVAYAGPGTSIVASGTRNGTTLFGTSLRLGITGRLIDAP
jgi:hypothetical protein